MLAVAMERIDAPHNPCIHCSVTGTYWEGLCEDCWRAREIERFVEEMK
jgi:hypothetical protein